MGKRNVKTGNLDVGTIGLIQQQPDGTIIQLGLTAGQSILLQQLVAQITTGKPAVRMPKEYNLMLVSEKEGESDE